MTSQKHILIVDDEKMIRMNMRALLEDLDFLVSEAVDGLYALAVFEKESPDLIITDLRMPKMDGLALIAALREINADIPVIVVSGTGTIHDAMEAVRLGAWDYITKPVNDQGTLEIVINRTLERHRLMQENRHYHEHLEELVRERTRELNESETRYRRLLESVTSYVYNTRFLDGKAIQTRHYHGCEALTGFTSEDYAAAPDLWFRMVYEEDRPLVLDMAQRILKTAAPIRFDHRLITKQGALRWVQSTLVPHRDSSGTLLSYDGIISDITERKRLEEQLRQAQKMEAIGLLAGGIAHDFNNILTVIIGYETLLKMHMKENDPQLVNVEQVLTAADRATHLTSSLLAFSRKQEMNPTVVNLNDIIRNVEKFLKRVIGEDVTLRANLSDARLNVMADNGQIEQVLMNLATNARDAMPHGGELVIETLETEMDHAFITAHGFGEVGRYALLRVIDCGEGMDVATRDRIFEPFFTTKEQGRGTGLGLSIVYGIVKQHNGYIDVESEKGKGTTFSMYLHSLQPTAADEIKVADESPGRGTETILVADDEASIRTLMENVLSRFGYTVITAEDGNDAVEKFRENADSISLVILDVIMPKLNGKDACNQIRKLCPDSKVIFISGYTADIVTSRGMLDENLEFLSKPLTPVTLLRKVREVLDRA